MNALKSSPSCQSVFKSKTVRTFFDAVERKSQNEPGPSSYDPIPVNKVQSATCFKSTTSRIDKIEFDHSPGPGSYDLLSEVCFQFLTIHDDYGKS